MNKLTTFFKGGLKSRRIATYAIAGAMSLAGLQSARAVAVDSEILLLVDVSKGVSNTDFTQMRQGIADSFRSSAVLNSIQTGSTGNIAVSLVFWSGISNQQTAVNWVNISDSTSAEAFAQSVESASRPWNNKKTALGDAISSTTGYFGDETGGTSNGFESSVQIVNVIGSSEDNNTPPGSNRPGAVAAARDLSIASGADIINGIAITANDPGIAAYYDSFVVGGTVGTQQGSTTSAATFASLESSFTPLLSSTITAAAVTTVPEPSSSFLVLASCALLLIRRR